MEIDFVHNPSSPLNGLRPESTLIPAPANTAIASAEFIKSIKLDCIKHLVSLSILCLISLQPLKKFLLIALPFKLLSYLYLH